MTQKLQPFLDLDEFFARVHVAAIRVLMLDYDGTLAPFHVDPAQARGPIPESPRYSMPSSRTGGHGWSS